MNAARIWIGRSDRGNRWHIVRNPGTAFPLGICGADVSRRSMHTAERLGPISGCKRCSRITEGSQS